MVTLPVRATYRRGSLTGEFDLIDRLRRRLPPAPPGQTWIGDDAAVVEDGWLLAADVVVEGVHVDLSLVGLDDVGWKALAVNVSDLAAMGGRPSYALVSLVLPPGCDVDLLYGGLAAAADEYGCAVVGGDVSGGPVLMVSVAVAGRVHGAVLRSGARPGDVVFVTGSLGGSAAGLAALRAGRSGEAAACVARHRRPVVRVAEGSVARSAGATAMIDVSDGLAVDLRRLASASGVGVVVESVPVDEAVPEWAGDRVALAWGGGEDYELVFTAPDPSAVLAEFASAGLRPPLLVGRCTGDVSDLDALPAAGWEHRW